MKQRVIVGLTGPTGSGKSLASKAAALCGFTVVDCDLLARRAVEKGTPGLRAVTEAFGSSVVSPDGSLDRKALARVAFSSSEQTERLNQTLLPHIMKLALKEAGEGDVLFDAPTLFESGLDRYCDKTVAVLAPRAVRLERIIRRDGLTIEEATLRLSAGKPDSFYRQNADYILWNKEREELFLTRFCEIIKTIQEMR